MCYWRIIQNRAGRNYKTLNETSSDYQKLKEFCEAILVDLRGD